MSSIIGVDIGGTLIRAARFDDDLTLAERTQQLTHVEDGLGAVLDRIYETIEQVLPEDPGDPTRIGVACPGPLDARTGIVLGTPNLPFDDTPLHDLLQARFGQSVYLGNDADLAGLAEYALGAGQGSRVMIYLTISTGIGGGIIIDGKPVIGSGMAGEIGHTVVDPNGPICTCGKPGHLEGIAAGTAIAKQARERIEAGEDSILRGMVDTLDNLASKEVGEAAQQGDALARQIVQRAGWHIGIAISTLMMTLHPDLFVLGGSVTQIGDLLLNPIHEAARTHVVHPRYYEDAPIVPAQLGADVGLIGAAVLARGQA